MPLLGSKQKPVMAAKKRPAKNKPSKRAAALEKIASRRRRAYGY